MIRNSLIKKIAILVCIVSMFTNIALAETGFSAVEEVNSSIISLPENSVKGHVSVKSISGRTYTNVLREEGNLESQGNWASSLETDTTERVFGFASGKIDNSAETKEKYAINSTELDLSGKYVFVSAYAKTASGTSNIAFYLLGYDNTDTLTATRSNGKTIDYTWTRYGAVFDLSSYGESYWKARLDVDTYGSSDDVVYFDGVMIMEISSDEFLEGADAMMEKYNFVNGSKSTLCALRLKSTGKNLLPQEFAHGAYDINTGSTNLDGSQDYVRYNGYIRVSPNTEYVFSNNSGAASRIIEFDENKNYIKYDLSDNVITSQSTYFVKLYTSKSGGIDLDTYQAQFEEGTTATAYETYQESISYVQAKGENGNIIEMHSLQNGVKDEIKDGKLYERIGELNDLGSGWQVKQELTNTILIQSNAIPYLIDSLYTSDSDGLILLIGSDVYYSKDADNLWNTDIEGVDFGSNGQVNIRINKSKLSTLDEIGFNNYLSANIPHALNYQLATEQVTDIPTTPLIGYSNGTIIIEPAISEGGIYDGSITINNSDLPIESIENVKRINNDSTRTMIDLSNITIAADGKSFTITGATNGESYEYEYMYPQELTTIPTISYSVPIDQNGQISGNTNMIQQNSELIDLILQEIQLLRDEINTME